MSVLHTWREDCKAVMCYLEDAAITASRAQRIANLHLAREAAEDLIYKIKRELREIKDPNSKGT